MRLAFMGTPAFSVPALKARIDAGHEIICVYTKAPKPVGRGHKVQPSAVHEMAISLGLPVRTPKTFRDPEEQEFFRTLNLDACVVVSYGLILPQPILDAPNHGCFNIHASLLPRWRGAAPIHRALLAGDTETGVTIMQMDAGLDTGDMLYKVTTPITPHKTTVSLFDELSHLGSTAMVHVLNHLETLPPTPQPTEGVTYADRIQKEEGTINWSLPAATIERMIRALSPWPGVTFTHNDLSLKLHNAQVVDATSTERPGTVLDDHLLIACGDKALRLLRVQRPTKAPLEAADFLRGYPILKGDHLS